MKVRLIVGTAALSVATLSSAMPVQTFLAKAEALKKKGPLALFSGDMKLLRSEIAADALELRKERLATAAAGRPTAFCPPSGGIKLTDRDVLSAMEAVPVAQRASIDTRTALRAYFARRYPCRTGA